MLRNYDQTVEFYRKNRIREMIQNGSRSHAATLFHNIFEAAITDKLDLRIVSGTLVRDFYEPLTARLQKLLVTNNVAVILTNPEPRELSQNTFMAALAQSPNGTCKRVIVEGLNNHFVVAGENIYRFELDHDRGMAAANFNDPKLGNRLVSMFAELDSVSSLFDPNNFDNAIQSVVPDHI